MFGIAVGIQSFSPVDTRLSHLHSNVPLAKFKQL